MKAQSLQVSALISWAHRRTGPRFLRWANLPAAVVFGYFGLHLLWRTV